MAGAAGDPAGVHLPVAGLGRGGARDVAGAAVGHGLGIADLVGGGAAGHVDDRGIDLEVVAGHLQAVAHVDLVDQLGEIELGGAVELLGAAGVGVAGAGRIAGGAEAALVGVAGDAGLDLDPVGAVVVELGVALVAGGGRDDLALRELGLHGRGDRAGGGHEVVDHVDGGGHFRVGGTAGAIGGVGVPADAVAAGVAVELDDHAGRRVQVDGDVAQGGGGGAAGGDGRGALGDVGREGVSVGAITVAHHGAGGLGVGRLQGGGARGDDHVVHPLAGGTSGGADQLGDVEREVGEVGDRGGGGLLGEGVEVDDPVAVAVGDLEVDHRLAVDVADTGDGPLGIEGHPLVGGQGRGVDDEGRDGAVGAVRAVHAVDAVDAVDAVGAVDAGGAIGAFATADDRQAHGGREDHAGQRLD